MDSRFTHLFYRLTAENHYAIPVGLLEDSDVWKLSVRPFSAEC